jgi:hypothetical protein
MVDGLEKAHEMMFDSLRGVLNQHKLAGVKEAFLRENEEGVKVELTDKSMSRDELQDAVHWNLENVTYNGIPVLAHGEPSIYDKVWDLKDDFQTVGADDGQEVYLGYLPESGLFVSGWDCWSAGYDEYGDYEGTESFGAYVTFTVAGDSVLRTGKIRTTKGPGMFYPNGYKEIQQRFPGIVDLRLD